MANIDILVCPNSTGGVKVWARNNDNSRVCYGGLSGSTRGLKIEDSAVTMQKKMGNGYARALHILDASFGLIDDYDLKEIVGGASRALTETAEVIQWDSLQSKICRALYKNSIGREYLARTINPASFGFQQHITIRNLDSLFGDGDPVTYAPAPQIVSAVTTVDARWSF